MKDSNGSNGATDIWKCPFLGEIPVKEDQRKCQGIKFCQFTDPELVNQEHCSADVDSEILQHYTQQNNNKYLPSNGAFLLCILRIILSRNIC